MGTILLEYLQTVEHIVDGQLEIRIFLHDIQRQAEALDIAPDMPGAGVSPGVVVMGIGHYMDFLDIVQSFFLSHSDSSFLT